MALYTILLGISIFMIAVVIAIIKKVYFRWKEENKIERMMEKKGVERPAVSIMINTEKCVIQRRQYNETLSLYEVMEKSDTSLNKTDANVTEGLINEIENSEKVK